MRKRICIAALLAFSVHALAQEAPAPAQVYITSRPEGALVVCDGVSRAATPVTLDNLSTGPHLIVARKQGYKEGRRSIELTAGQRSAIEFDLEPIRGLLMVHSEPDGAQVQIDGADRGTTPLLVTDLLPGTYRMHVALGGYVPKDIEVTLEDRTPVKVSATLVSDSAALTIDSTPPGARVTINGLVRGTAPCRLDRVPGGVVEVELTLDGFHPYRKTLRLAPGQKESLTAVLDPIPAELTIVTIPPDARVYIDNQFRGKAPFTLTDLQPGAYRVRVDLVGFESLARTIDLRQAQELVEEFRMPNNSGILELTTEPSGVQVFLDGESKGFTDAKPDQTDRVSEPFQVDILTVGDHQLQLTRKGFFSQDVTITIEKDKTFTLHHAMNRRFIPDYEVETDTDLYRGVLQAIEPTGDVRLEVRPGIFKTIPAADIKARRPYRKQ